MFAQTLLSYAWTLVSQSNFRLQSTLNGSNESHTNGTSILKSQSDTSQLVLVQAGAAISEVESDDQLFKDILHSKHQQEEIKEIFDDGAVYIDEYFSVPLRAPAYQASMKPFPCDPPEPPKEPKGRPLRNRTYNAYRSVPDSKQTTIQVIDDDFNWASSNETTKDALASVPIASIVNGKVQKDKSPSSSEKNGDILKGHKEEVIKSKFC